MGRIFRVESGAYFLLAAWLLCLPLEWCIAAVIAAAMHELFHLLAIYLSGGAVSCITLRCTGAVLETTPLKPGHEVFCAAAGPFGSLIMLFFSNHIPEVAVFALAQGLFNLLPVYPLDGGRIVCCLFPDEVCKAIGVFTNITATGLGIWGCWKLNLGPACLLPSVLLWSMLLPRKFPCKE